MNNHPIPCQAGRVASLHLHPSIAGEPLVAVDEVKFVEAKGIEGDLRYFGKISRSSGAPTRRQVTLMERERIAEHAQALGLKTIPAGAVRANVETRDIDLVALLGREIEIGEARLLLYAPRDPCQKMDALCRGLRERMLNQRQGVLAQVRRSGNVRIGDRIRLVPPAGEPIG